MSGKQLSLSVDSRVRVEHYYRWLTSVAGVLNLMRKRDNSDPNLLAKHAIVWLSLALNLVFAGLHCTPLFSALSSKSLSLVYQSFHFSRVSHSIDWFALQYTIRTILMRVKHRIESHFLLRISLFFWHKYSAFRLADNCNNFRIQNDTPFVPIIPVSNNNISHLRCRFL